jgi:hypothetical protein
MSCVIKIFIFFLLATVGLQSAQAQNLQGKKIYVTDKDEVMLEFKSPITQSSFIERGADTIFEQKFTNNRFILISSKYPSFKTVTLRVVEGKNTHHFLIVNKEKLDPDSETSYDFSTKEKLEQEIRKLEEEKKKAPKPKGEDAPGAGSSTTADVKTIVVKPEGSFDDIILKANAEYTKNNLDDAEKLFRAALVLKPGDLYCTELLNRIDTKRNAAAIKEREAIAGKVYNLKLSTADSLYNLKLYSQSKAHYQDLLKDRPGDLYLTAQIKKIDQLASEERFKSFMDVGRNALAQQELDDAELAFKEALKIKPNNPEASKELKKIAPAKAAIQKQQQSLSAEQAKQKRFDDTLYLADNMYAAGMYDDAKKKYLAAGKMKPGHPHVTRRLSQLDSIVTKLKADIVRLRRDSANLVAYRNEVNKADKAFENKEYTKAKQLYQSAHRMNPEDKYLEQRLSSIDILMQQAENEKKDAAARKIEQENRKKQYNLFMKEGKAAMSKNDYNTAERHFLKVQELEPGDSYAASQLQVIQQKINEIAENARYDSAIARGNRALAARQHNDAIDYYRQAKVIRPNETYPDKQIAATNQEMLDLGILERQQVRSKAFNAALPYFKYADSLRVHNKYEEAWVGYGDFLSRVDTVNTKDYMRSEIYYINLAKGYMVRLDRYKPVPKQEVIQVAPPPAAPDKKKKKKGKN